MKGIKTLFGFIQCALESNTGRLTVCPERRLEDAHVWPLHLDHWPQTLRTQVLFTFAPDVCHCLCFILNSFWFSTIISVSSLACPVCLMVESAPAALGLRWTLKLFEDCLHTCPVSTVCSQTQHHWILTSVTQPPPSKMLLHHPESLCTFQITVSHLKTEVWGKWAEYKV